MTIGLESPRCSYCGNSQMVRAFKYTTSSSVEIESRGWRCPRCNHYYPDSECKHESTVLTGHEPHFQPRKYFSVPVMCPNCGKAGEEIYECDRIEGFE